MDPPSEGIYVQKPGPWFRNDEGAFAWASLGMLADHGLSLVLLDGHPPGMNGMVTTELSIDFNPAADPSDDEFRLDTHIVGISQVGGLSKGEISNRRGDRVAIASLSGRYLPVPEGGYLELPPAPAETVPFTTMLPMLFEGTSDGAIGTLPIPLWLANPRGIMHGGIHTIALEYTARKTLGEALWRPTSIRVSFLRGIPVDDLLTVVATRVHTGRSLTVVRVESRRTDGKLAGIATVSYEAR
ncbi:PaaI family thioesterase [Leucobacter denitrificans]|uniref:PaaI family thioesterase n=1 Tax=Leucobacter denitrificans TaxID=683042 RepID=A0A7G9S561_9MICO|nr:PaaI family thioesterase [Leucobacter denitrificans]QNN62986.1 PaaI family thioesterase [Leucobacter denitrificans]